MKANFYATLRQITGQKTVEFVLSPEATIGELLHQVLETYPPMTEHLIDENGELYRHVHLFINGRDVCYLENTLKTPLNPTDKVDFFPAVGGG